MNLDWFLNQNIITKTLITVGIGFLFILIIILLTDLIFPSDSPLKGTDLEKYKESCTVISFQELNNNTNRYKGQHVKFTGQIVQINKNNEITEIVLAVTRFSDGWSSSDLIFVTYRAQTEFKKGDIVTVYGDVAGTYKYFSTTGELTIVKITAKYIELAQITSTEVIGVPFTNPVTNESTNNTINSSGSENTSYPNSPANTSLTTTHGESI